MNKELIRIGHKNESLGVIISQKRALEALAYFQQQMGIALTLKVLLKIVRNNPVLAVELVTDGYTDTSPREEFMNEIGLLLAGKSWPRYCDGEKAMDQFLSKLRKGAKKYHCTVEPGLM